MKRNILIVGIAVIIAWIPYLIGAWDGTKPIAGRKARFIDDDIRANNSSLETAIDQDHDFTTGSTQSGKHETVILMVQSTPGASIPAASEGALYTKDVSAKAELHFEDEDDNEIQLTSVGKINGAALKNDSVDSAHYAAGSIDLEHLSANSADSDQYVDGSIDAAHLAADVIDETKIADNGINSEHYNDGSLDAVHLSDSAKKAGFSPTSYTGGETTTLPTGLIIKMGSIARSETDTTVTLGTAFPNGIVTAIACGGVAYTAASEIATHTLTISSFKIRNPNSGQTTMRWIAIGH